MILERSVTADESLYLTRVKSGLCRPGTAGSRMAGAGHQRYVPDCGAGRNGRFRSRDGAPIRFQRCDHALFPQMAIITSQNGDFSDQVVKWRSEQDSLHRRPCQDLRRVGAQRCNGTGCHRVLEEAGLDPGADMLIVSIDAEPDMLRALAEGDANATVELSPLLAGPAFDAIADYSPGKPYPNGFQSEAAFLHRIRFPNAQRAAR